VPLPRFTSIRGIPVTQLIAKDKLDAIITRTRNGGIEVVNILGTSAYYAPGAGAVKMARAILRDEKKVVACCAWCQKEYQAGGHFVGVPAVLGARGVERVIELDLDADEKKLFAESLSHVQQLVAKVDTMLG
jgi:malate dehydrogenase